MLSEDQPGFSWPTGRRFYLTLDLECDFGTALRQNTYQALEAADRLAALLDTLDIPLTCFVQTEVLDEKPEAVEILRDAVDVTFHPHSHTHRPRNRTDIDDEVATSTERYRDYFGAKPEGYRLPNGNIRPEDYRTLAAHGYSFDASVFPSWRPNHFDNTDAPIEPQYLNEFDLFEIPFTVYSETVRIPSSLSYCRVLGRPFLWTLINFPPNTVVFNIHMHDLVTPRSYRHLTRFYRFLYRRNDHGFKLLERILEEFSAREYNFSTIDRLHDRFRSELAALDDD